MPRAYLRPAFVLLVAQRKSKQRYNEENGRHICAHLLHTFAALFCVIKIKKQFHINSRKIPRSMAKSNRQSMGAESCSNGHAESSVNSPSTATTEEEELLLEFAQREGAYRSIIAVSSVFSIGALLCLCVLLPSLYGHVHSLAGFARKDFAFCEASSSNFIAFLNSLSSENSP